jgi:ribose transport system ATP-binding protein
MADPQGRVVPMPAAPGFTEHRADVLQMQDIGMRFGAVTVLSGVNLSVRRGEILGLLGQNGSGKSTLIKVLAGFNQPEPGSRITMWGDTMTPPLDPARIARLGVAFVHQHLGLVGSLSVADNLLVGDDRHRRPWALNWRAEGRRIGALFAEFGLTIDPAATVESLSPVERAFVAIVRAFDVLRRSDAGRAGEGILVLDEPTPFLARDDVGKLFALLRSICRTGASVILVTHDIDEVMEITDRIAVMRDGRLAAVFDTEGASRTRIVDAIVGRSVSHFIRPARDLPDAPAVRMAGVSGGRLKPFDTTLRRGEILGVTGLIGSGFADIPYLLFGARPATGTLTLGERVLPLAAQTPDRAIRAGLALLPGDRIGQGGVGSLGVIDNATLLSMPRLRGPLGLNPAALRRQTEGLIARHDVRPPRADLALANLSGGNQQKVLLGKWLAEDPALLLLDEPTQGVDIGARQQIFAALDAAAGQGMAVLIASTDAEQLAQVCDRVLVFARGAVVQDLTGAQVTKDTIARACLNSGAAPQDDAPPSAREVAR